METSHWWYVARRKILVKVLHSLKLENERDILEIGCGSGGNLELLSMYGNVFAMEMDDGARERAEKRQIGIIRKGSVPDFNPFENKRFDLIAMLDVLEHIEDDQTVLLSLHNILRRNGKLLITVPAFPFLWSKLDEVNLHKRRYVRSTLIRLVHHAGFAVGYSTYFNALLFPFIIMIRLMNRAIARQNMIDGEEITGRINTFLSRIFSLEIFLIPRFSLPFGVSLLIIAQKTGCEH
jgi:SAM-dependent methyltransferase